MQEAAGLLCSGSGWTRAQLGGSPQMHNAATIAGRVVIPPGTLNGATSPAGQPSGILVFVYRGPGPSRLAGQAPIKDPNTGRVPAGVPEWSRAKRSGRNWDPAGWGPKTNWAGIHDSQEFGLVEREAEKVTRRVV